MVFTHRFGGRMACQPYCQGRRIRPYRKSYCRSDRWSIGRMVGVVIRLVASGGFGQPSYLADRSYSVAAYCVTLLALDACELRRVLQ